ncbi:MAG: GAF domain-containing protein [Candidatus Levybacteria bacterium]|nr:GAF domain-containing protein [Candidatus Levybacteria bacterium]
MDPVQVPSPQTTQSPPQPNSIPVTTPKPSASQVVPTQPSPPAPQPTASQPAQTQPTSPPSPSTPTSAKPSGVPVDLEHINREMYKRNLELAERNKTLSLLRKLDELILSSVTDVKETAMQVTKLLVEQADFRLAALFLLDQEKKNLSLVAFAKPPSLTADEQLQLDRFTMIKSFSTSLTNNLLVQALLDKKVKTSNSLVDVLQTGSLLGTEDALIIQKIAGIKSALIFPIIVREEIIGAMVVCQQFEISDLNEYQWDLLERLIAVIGIAIDNALLYSEVQTTNQKLKVLDRLKDEFVSLASHELRTPMTAIKSYLWLFLEDNKQLLNEKQKMYIERAYTSTDRLINLVNDMLNVSRIESGRLIINKKPVNVIQLIAEIVNEILPSVNEENKKVLFVQPKTELSLVDADPDKIKQVLLNIVGNSVKFTPPGGRIEISTNQSDGLVILSVHDTGKGISQEDLPKLFKKFSIVGTTTVLTHGAQSTGLGLYISKSIVELHKGKIWVNSDGEGKGATFSFSLPVSQSSTPLSNNYSVAPTK